MIFKIRVPVFGYNEYTVEATDSDCAIDALTVGTYDYVVPHLTEPNNTSVWSVELVDNRN